MRWAWNLALGLPVPRIGLAAWVGIKYHPVPPRGLAKLATACSGVHVAGLSKPSGRLSESLALLEGRLVSHLLHDWLE